jgi:hypothetical protein
MKNFTDDSTESNTSPIREHVDRRLIRTGSTSTFISRPKAIRAPSEELLSAVEQAYGSLTGVLALEGEQLLRLRAMLEGISGKIDEALVAKKPPV